MIIKFNGETTLNKLPKLIKEIVEDVQAKAGIETAKVKVKDAQLGLVFSVGEEMHYMTVTHDGVTEIFQTNVKLDDKGNIERLVDNEESSFLDDYSRAVAMGQGSPKYEPIESIYNDEDLELIETENGGDIVGNTYTNKATGEQVVRYYKDNILIGEMGYRTK